MLKWIKVGWNELNWIFFIKVGEVGWSWLRLVNWDLSMKRTGSYCNFHGTN